MRSVVRALIVVAVVAMAGCKVIPHGAMVADVSPKGWEPEEIVALRYDNADTTSLTSIHLVARRECGQEVAPLAVRVRVCAPDSAEVDDVVLLPTKGENGGGSFEEVEVLWVEKAQLQLGEYTFYLSPQEPAKGLWNVGVEIER